MNDYGVVNRTQIYELIHINPSYVLSDDSSNKQILKSKILTSSWGGTRKLPYAFTEQGVYMLMTVLKGELATYQSKALIRAFKEMKEYRAHLPLRSFIKRRRK